MDNPESVRSPPWSSYPGYHWKNKRFGWIAYDAVYRAWLVRRLTVATLRDLVEPFAECLTPDAARKIVSQFEYVRTKWNTM